MEPHSIYIHIPFCRSRCGYCDFNTTAGMQHLIPVYINALCMEIGSMGNSLPQPIPVHTVFFGGGTPSLLTGPQVAKVLASVNKFFDLLPGAEITLEANPGTVKLETLIEWYHIGVNRLSFGMQSSHPEELVLLQRQHQFSDVVQAVRWAKQAGINNINLDLIFGLPAQTLGRWQNSVEMALSLDPTHLSLYSLTVEPETPLNGWVNRGLVPPPNDDDSAEMYEWADERLGLAGYEQYEISNWASKNDSDGVLRSCRHNLQYWHNKPYFGFGSGAHAFVAGYRTANHEVVSDYIRLCHQNIPSSFPIGLAAEVVNPVDLWSEMQETMMVGLRLTAEGVGEKEFQLRFGKSMLDVFGSEIDRLVRNGLLEWANIPHRCLRLTYRGRLLGNRVFMEFVGEQGD